MYFEVYVDDVGDYRWRLQARNGKILADSGEGYERKSACLNSIKRIKKVNAETKVKEIEENES